MYGLTAHRGFESLPLRHKALKRVGRRVALIPCALSRVLSLQWRFAEATIFSRLARAATDGLIYNGGRGMAWEHLADHCPKAIAWLKQYFDTSFSIGIWQSSTSGGEDSERQGGPIAADMLQELFAGNAFAHVGEDSCLA